MYVGAAVDLLLFFFNNPATTEIYTLSLHDALPILRRGGGPDRPPARQGLLAHGARRHVSPREGTAPRRPAELRSEEHTSELQSRQYLVCRLLLEKKNVSASHAAALLYHLYDPL